jgi:taurine transport system ATP-binding protein
MEDQIIIALNALDVVFNNTMVALRDINLDIRKGEFVCLLGPSGCGKTTLLNVLSGFVKPAAGNALVDGEEIQGPDKNRGLMFQQPVLYPWLNVQQNVEFGLKMQKTDKAERRAISDKYLAQVGLADFKTSKPYELSGGMRQRASLARLLSNSPKIILMDEPFGALDAITRANMQQLTRRIWVENKATFFLITHDVDEALSLGTRVLVMSARPGHIIKEFSLEFTYMISDDAADRTRFSAEYLRVREDAINLIHKETSEASGYTI